MRRDSSAACTQPVVFPPHVSASEACKPPNEQPGTNTCTGSRDTQPLPCTALHIAEQGLLQMEDDLAAVRGDCDEEGVGRDCFGSCGLRIPKIHRTGRSSEQQLATLRHVKNLLVGNTQAKRVALGLSLVEDILAFLDDAAGTTAGGHYESALLHAVGLLAILNCTRLERRLAEVYLAPNGSRIVGHIIRALEWCSKPSPSTSTRRVGDGRGIARGERLTAVTLRAVSSLCQSVVPVSITTSSTACPVDVDAAAAAREERDKAVAELKKVSVLIIEKISASSTAAASSLSPPRSIWSLSSISLGVEALATLTRVEELARSLVPLVVSTDTMLLEPLLPRNFYGSATSMSPRGACTETVGARNAPAVLELLVNLSCADSYAVAAWLTSCDSRKSGTPGGVLKGLEVELTNGDDKVRVLAGLVLVNCFKSSKTGDGTAPAAAAPTATVNASSRFNASLSWPPSNDSPALDEVIAHRVLPLFFRMLKLWAALPSTTHAESNGNGGYLGRRTDGHSLKGGSTPARSPTSYPNAAGYAAAGDGGGFATVCGGYAAAVMAAVTGTIELGSWQRQRDAVTYGAVDSLVAFLRRAHMEAMATELGPPPSVGGNSGDDVGATERKKSTCGTPSAVAADSAAAAAAADAEWDRRRNARLVRTGTETGLNALATLCARCEAARERTVALGFHLNLTVGRWLETGAHVQHGSSHGGAGGDGGVGEDGPGRKDSNGVALSGYSGGGSGDAVLLAALSLVRNLGRSSVACSALVGVGTHERLLGVMMMPDRDGGDGAGGTARRAARRGGNGETRGAVAHGEESSRATKSATAGPAAGRRAALVASCLANMALEHEVVKEAIVGSEESLRRLCGCALDFSTDQKSARVASIAVLKSTCFLASLRVRAKVTYFLGGVDGMISLLQGPCDEAVLQGLYTLRNLLHGASLRALSRSTRETTPSPSGVVGGGDRGSEWDSGPSEGTAAAAVAAAEPAATAEEEAAGAGEERHQGHGSPAGAGGGGGAPAPPAAAVVSGASSRSSTLDWRRAAATSAITSGRGGGAGGRQQRRDWQGWRGHRGESGGRAERGNTAMRIAQEGLLEAPFFPSSSSRGSGGSRTDRGLGGSGGGRHRGRYGGFFSSGGRRTGGSTHDGARPQPMDVVGESSGSGSSSSNGGDGGGACSISGSVCGSEGGIIVGAAESWGGERRLAGVARSDFARLTEAVLGTVGGSGGGGGGGGQGRCDEISCAALRLLHVLSTADESQRTALRTPRVLHAALTFFTPSGRASGGVGSNSFGHSNSAGGVKIGDENNRKPQQQQQQPLETSSTTLSSTNARGTVDRSPDEGAETGTGASAATPGANTAASGNVAARLLLSELLPQQSGDRGNSASITAAFATLFRSEVAATAAAGTGGAGSGGVTAGAGAASASGRVLGWEGGAGGMRRGRSAVNGAWCSGLEFDRAAGGARQPGGE